MRAADAKPGTILGDRFLLTEQLARGGMATIFKAEDLTDGRRPVVVKVPLPLFSSVTGTWTLFQREEEIGLALDHPFVLKFVRLPADKRRTYVVTEYVAGIPLSQHMKVRCPLPEPEALAITSRICEAIAHVHDRGVVHYDVKPENVILCPDGSIRLIDFGLAHGALTSRFTLAGRPPAIATSSYAAPEQVQHKRGRKSVDIYAVGAVLYEMLTGQPPFPGDDPFVVASARTLGDPPAPRKLNPRLSPEAEEIVLRALRRDPTERYASAAAMKKDLDDPLGVTVSGLAARLQPVTPARRFWRRARYVALVAIIPVAAQVVLFWLFLRAPARHAAHPSRPAATASPVRANRP